MVINYYLEEIKARVLLIGYSFILNFCIIFYYREEYYLKLMGPLMTVVEKGKFISTNMFEVIYGYIFLSVILSGCICFCLLFYNIYGYLVPGIYEYRVKRINKVFLWLGIFIIIITISYKHIILGVVLNYLYGYSLGNGVMEFEIVPKMYENLKYIIYMYIVGIILVAMPVIVGGVEYIWGRDQVSVIKYRRVYYLMIILLIIGILPPDTILHLGVFGCIFMIVEFYVFAYYILKEYNLKIRS